MLFSGLVTGLVGHHSHFASSFGYMFKCYTSKFIPVKKIMGYMFSDFQL